MEALNTLATIGLVMMGMTLVIVPLIGLPVCESQDDVRKVLRLIVGMLLAELTFPLSFPLLGIWGLVRWYYRLPEKVDPNNRKYYGDWF